MNFAFISRHQPTDSQHELAAAQGHTLVHVGDADAFTVDAGFVHKHGPFEGVVVVHPAAALRLADQFVIGVFENANRAPIGEKPQFEAVAFHLYEMAGPNRTRINTELTTMEEEDLKEILAQHILWVRSRGEKGARANLSGADLRWADLSGADLRWADLSGADLSRANLWRADLRRTDLSGADLRWADLQKANLRRTDLSDADLREADLRWADLQKADLRRADLKGADLWRANLTFTICATDPWAT